MKEVNTLDLFGHPQLYRNMPKHVFDALFAAYLDCMETISISEEDYGKIFGNH